MKIRVVIQSGQLSARELRLLLQSVRDCGQRSFPDKLTYIQLEAPDLSNAEARDLLARIRPPFALIVG